LSAPSGTLGPEQGSRGEDGAKENGHDGDDNDQRDSADQNREKGLGVVDVKRLAGRDETGDDRPDANDQRQDAAQQWNETQDEEHARRFGEAKRSEQLTVGSSATKKPGADEIHDVRPDRPADQTSQDASDQTANQAARDAGSKARADATGHGDQDDDEERLIGGGQIRLDF